MPFKSEKQSRSMHANNPKMGNNGNLSWLIYGVNDDGDKSSLFKLIVEHLVYTVIEK